MVSAIGERTDRVWFKQLRGNVGAIIHLGDNLTGAGDGDGESIIVNLQPCRPALTLWC